MNWLYFAFPLILFYLIWFGRLIRKEKPNRIMFWYAMAHFPYLLVNLVAPFRGILDPNYAGYNMGWISLPKGIGVTLVVGAIVISCFMIMTRAMQNRLKEIRFLALITDVVLSIMIALPLLINILSDLSGSRIELGEYLQISGLVVAGIIFVLFSGPTFWATYVAVRHQDSETR